MPRRNRRQKIETTDEEYGYGYRANVAVGKCPRPGCSASFAADDYDQVQGAVQDHLDNAHDQAEVSE